MSEKKNIAFYILEILQRYSSEKSPLSCRDISRCLLTDHNRECDPRTIKSALTSLISLGYDIKLSKQKNNFAWYISKLLDRDDVICLMMSLFYSPYASPDTINRITGKLAPIINEVDLFKYFSSKRGANPDYEAICENLRIINKSIELGFMINFPYISYFVDGKPCFERDIMGRVCDYLVKPITIICSKDAAQLFAEIGDTGKLRYFNIERIYSPKLTDIHFTRLPADTSFAPTNKLERRSPSTNMRERAVLLCDDSILSQIYDSLGKSMNIISSYNGKSEVEIFADYQILIPFVLRFGSKIEALSPTKLRRAVSLELHSSASKYRFQSKLKGYLN